MAADTYNNPTFNPDSVIIAHVHQDFRAAIDLSYTAVEAMGPMDRDWAHNKFNEMKNQRLQVITKATASGQGDGSRNDEDDDFINDDVVELGRDYQLSNSLAALGFGSHVLYFDHMINHHCIVAECTQQLTEGNRLDNGSVPNIAENKDKRRGRGRGGKSAVDADIQNAIEKEMKVIKDSTRVLSAQIADANLDNLMKQISEKREKIIDLEDAIEEEKEKEHPRENRLLRHTEHLEQLQEELKYLQEMFTARKRRRETELIPTPPDDIPSDSEPLDDEAMADYIAVQRNRNSNRSTSNRR